MKKKIKWKSRLFILSLILSPVILTACGNQQNDVTIEKENPQQTIAPTKPIVSLSVLPINLNKQNDLSKFFELTFPEDTNFDLNQLINNLKTNLGIDANNKLLANNNFKNINYYLDTKNQLSDADIKNIDEVDLNLDTNRSRTLREAYLNNQAAFLNFVIKFKNNNVFQNKYNELKVSGKFKIKITDNIVFDSTNIYYSADKIAHWQQITGTESDAEENNIANYVMTKMNEFYSNKSSSWNDKLKYLLALDSEQNSSNSIAPLLTNNATLLEELPSALESVTISDVQVVLNEGQSYNKDLVKMSATFAFKLKEDKYFWESRSRIVNNRQVFDIVTKGYKIYTIRNVNFNVTLKTT